jgi:hypothetical protein
VVAHIVRIGMRLLGRSEKQRGVRDLDRVTLCMIRVPGIRVRRCGHDACLAELRPRVLGS